MDLVVAVFHTPMESATDKLVMLTLAEHAWADGTHCYPSVERLATFGSMNRATVQRALKRLLSGGWIKVVAAASQHRPTEYLLALGMLQGPQFATPEIQGLQSVEPGVASSRPGVATSRARGRTLLPEPEALNLGEPVGNLVDGPPAGIQFQIPDSIVKALDRCAVLGAAVILRKPKYWQAQVRAYGRVDIAAQLLRAETWIAANPNRAPKKNMGRFVRNWLDTAFTDLLEAGDA